MRITVAPSKFGGQVMTRRVCDRAACRRPFITAFTRRGEPGEFCSDFCLRNKDNNDMSEQQTANTNVANDSPIVSGNPQPDSTTPKAQKAKKGNPVSKKHKAAAKPAVTASAKPDKSDKKTAKAAKTAKTAKATKTAKPAKSAAAAASSNGHVSRARRFDKEAKLFRTDTYKEWLGSADIAPSIALRLKTVPVKDGMTVQDWMDKRREANLGSGSGPLKAGKDAGALEIRK